MRKLTGFLPGNSISISKLRLNFPTDRSKSFFQIFLLAFFLCFQFSNDLFTQKNSLDWISTAPSIQEYLDINDDRLNTGIIELSEDVKTLARGLYQIEQHSGGTYSGHVVIEQNTSVQGGVLFVNSFRLPKDKKLQLREDLIIISKGDVVIDGDISGSPIYNSNQSGQHLIIKTDGNIIIRGNINLSDGGDANPALAHYSIPRPAANLSLLGGTFMPSALFAATQAEHGGLGGSLLVRGASISILGHITVGAGGKGTPCGQSGNGGSITLLSSQTSHLFPLKGGNGGSGSGKGGDGGDAQSLWTGSVRHYSFLPNGEMIGGNGGDGSYIPCMGLDGTSNTGSGDQTGTDGNNGSFGSNCDGGIGGDGTSTDGNGSGGNGGDGQPGNFGTATDGGIGGNGGNGTGGNGGNGQGGDGGDGAAGAEGTSGSNDPGGNGGSGGIGGDGTGDNGGSGTGGIGGNGGNGANGATGIFGSATAGGAGGNGGNGGRGGAGIGGSGAVGGIGTGGAGGVAGNGGNGAVGQPGNAGSNADGGDGGAGGNAGAGGRGGNGIGGDSSAGDGADGTAGNGANGGTAGAGGAGADGDGTGANGSPGSVGAGGVGGDGGDSCGGASTSGGSEGISTPGTGGIGQSGGANGSNGASVSPCINLPVTLISFAAQIQGEIVQLSWLTADELNNAGFQVLHSTNGSDWNILTNIEGMGTTNVAQSYSYQHNNVSKGIHFYRLLQMDFDGRSAYSNIVAVEMGGEGARNEIRVFPNPAQSGHITIALSEIDDQGSLLLIHDQMGRLVKSKVINRQLETIDISELPKGIYWLSGNFAGSIVREKIVVQ